MKSSQSQALYPHCPVRGVLSRISGKWPLLVIHALDIASPLRFGELRKEMLDISPKMLAQTLRELEEDGIVSRTVYPVVPPHVEYALTTRGQSLLRCLNPLLQWAVDNMSDILHDRAASNGAA